MPTQMIYAGQTDAVLPKSKLALQLLKEGWCFSRSQNHWSTRDTMIEWLHTVLVPWRLRKCVQLGVDPGHQRLVVLLDNFSAHVSDEFLAECRKFDWMSIIFLPPNMTQKVQPLDVGFNRPFKCRMQSSFPRWFATEVAKQQRMDPATTPLKGKPARKALRVL